MVQISGLGPIALMLVGVGRFQGGFSGIFDNLNSFLCLHLLLISAVDSCSSDEISTNQPSSSAREVPPLFLIEFNNGFMYQPGFLGGAMISST